MPHFVRQRARFRSSRPRVLLMVLLLYGFTQIINLLVWILYISTDRQSWGSVAVNAYIVFVGLGLFSFFIVSSPLIYWPYAHGGEMSPKARRDTACLGIVVSFITHDFPIAWLEIWSTQKFGFEEIFQGISLFLSVFCFAIGFCTLWLSYTWKMSKVLQVRFGTAAPRATVKASDVSRVAAAQYI